MEMEGKSYRGASCSTHRPYRNTITGWIKQKYHEYRMYKVLDFNESKSRTFDRFKHRGKSSVCLRVVRRFRPSVSFIFRSSDIESLKEEENVFVDAPYQSTSISRTAERQKLFLRRAMLPDFVKIRNT